MPSAAIRLGGRLSSVFELARGTRQGCPLSPALFAIAMEPVAEALHVSPHIKGLRLAWLEERVALYADDLLLFLNDASSSLQGALLVLGKFSEVTGLRSIGQSRNCLPLMRMLKGRPRPHFSYNGWTNLHTWGYVF